MSVNNSVESVREFNAQLSKVRNVIVYGVSDKNNKKKDVSAIKTILETCNLDFVKTQKWRELQL